MANEISASIPKNDLKVAQTLPTRLSIRVPRPADSTPRAAATEPTPVLESPLSTDYDLDFARASSPKTSNIDSNDITSQATVTSTLITDSSSEDEDFAAQGLEALAAAAAPVISTTRNTIAPSPMSSTESAVDEDMSLASLFAPTNISLDSLVERHVADPGKRPMALNTLLDIINRTNHLLQSASISLRVDHIFIQFLSRLLPYEAARTQRADFAYLLVVPEFLPAVAVVLSRLTRLSAVALSLTQATTALQSTLFDVLLVIEPVVRMLPELMKLPSVNAELRALEQYLIESAVWQECAPFYRLLADEDSVQANVNPVISKLARPIYASHKALESLTGFASNGSALTRLELFFRKFLRLASIRLQLATRALGLPLMVSQLAWEFFVELAGSEGHFVDGHRCKLFYRRHLNHILMAVLFSVARLSDQERTFAQIAACLPDSHYYWNKKESEDDEETELMHAWMDMRTGRISKVFVSEDGGDRGSSFCDFFTFYNQIFLPPLQRRLQRLVDVQEEVRHQSKRHRMSQSSMSLLCTEKLFTSAPIPSPKPRRHLSDNVSIEVARVDGFRQTPSPFPSQSFQYINPVQKQYTPPVVHNSTSSTPYSDEELTSEPKTDDASIILQYHQQQIRSPKSSLRSAVPHKT